MSIPSCDVCGHGQAGHGGRRCIQARLIRSSWESTNYDDVEECGCTEKASIDQLKKICDHYEKMLILASKRYARALRESDAS